MAIEEIIIDPGRVTTPQPATAPIGGRVHLLGWSIRETSGAAAASLVIHNGSDATGMEAGGIDLAQGASALAWFGPQGILLNDGYFPVVTGAVAGSVYVHIL